MGPGTILVAAVAFGVIVLISKSIRVVQQAQTMIVERLGKYHKTLSSGINFVLPLIDRPRSVDWHQTIVTHAGDSYSRRNDRLVPIDRAGTVDQGQHKVDSGAQRLV